MNLVLTLALNGWNLCVNWMIWAWIFSFWKSHGKHTCSWNLLDSPFSALFTRQCINICLNFNYFFIEKCFWKLIFKLFVLEWSVYMDPFTQKQIFLMWSIIAVSWDAGQGISYLMKARKHKKWGFTYFFFNLIFK